MANRKKKHRKVKVSSKWGPIVWSYLKKVRNRAPLVQCITSPVSMDLTANTLLAAGASSTMIDNIPEISNVTRLSEALYVNIGMVTDDSYPAMKEAAEATRAAGKPWVFDPAGAGISLYRTDPIRGLMSIYPTVVRGNASEIYSVCEGTFGRREGVKSNICPLNVLTVAMEYSKIYGTIFAISGEVDIVTDGHRAVGVKNGVEMMQKIASCGCALSALVASFLGAIEDPTDAFQATVSALAIFAVAGEVAMEKAKGPGSLRMHLLDSLYTLDKATVTRRVKILVNMETRALPVTNY